MAAAAPAILILTPADNVGVACRAIAPGETVARDGTSLMALDPIPRAHKIALRPIAMGERVFRAGVPIGTATVAIRAGAHVHVQNLTSNYMPTFTFDGPVRFGEDPA